MFIFSQRLVLYWAVNTGGRSMLSLFVGVRRYSVAICFLFVFCFSLLARVTFPTIGVFTSVRILRVSI